MQYYPKMLCLVDNKNFRRLKNVHISHSYNKNSSSYNAKFHKAIRKYGLDSFEWRILVEIKTSTSEELSESLNELEWYYIKKYNSYNCGYNSTRGGDNNNIRPPRIVIMYNVDGQKLQEYDSTQDAAALSGIHISTIKLVLNKLLKFVKKGYKRYVFRFDGDNYTKQEIDLNLKSLLKERIYVYDAYGQLINECLNLEDFCIKYDVKIRQARKCLAGEIYYLISLKFPDRPVIISKGIPPTKEQLEYTRNFYKSPENSSRFFITVIDNQTNKSKIYSNLSLASRELNLNYRKLLRELGFLKKALININNYTILNLKYHGS